MGRFLLDRHGPVTGPVPMVPSRSSLPRAASGSRGSDPTQKTGWDHQYRLRGPRFPKIFRIRIKSKYTLHHKSTYDAHKHLKRSRIDNRLGFRRAWCPSTCEQVMVGRTMRSTCEVGRTMIIFVLLQYTLTTWIMTVLHTRWPYFPEFYPTVQKLSILSLVRVCVCFERVGT
jgi:hypothetical protein